LPEALDQDPARAELVRDRFAVLWEASISGRLARAGDPFAAVPAVPERFRRAFGSTLAPFELTELHAEAWRGGLATQASILERAQRPLADPARNSDVPAYMS
jgi:hypothetical protein